MVTVNGKPMDIKPGTTVEELLDALKVNAEQVVVQLNLEIITREHLGKRTVNPGDKVEILSFVGGG